VVKADALEISNSIVVAETTTLKGIIIITCQPYSAVATACCKSLLLYLQEDEQQAKQYGKYDANALDDRRAGDVDILL